jgi:hypothetical protein
MTLRSAKTVLGFAFGVVLITTYSFSTHSSVLAYGGGAGCQGTLDRSDVYPYFRLDGWQYPAIGNGSSTPVTGVQTELNAYSNYYGSRQTTDTNAFDYDWVMLTNNQTGSAQRWAQVGLATGPFVNSANGYKYSPSLQSPTGITTPPLVTIQTFQQGASHPNPLVVYPQDGIQPGQRYWFSVLYNTDGSGHYISGEWAFTMTPAGGSTVVVATIPPGSGGASGLGWTPTQAEIMGETHSDADQMFGDTYTPVLFSTSQYYEGSWTAMNLTGNVQYWNKGTSNPSGTWTYDPEYGYNDPGGSPSQLQIWDQYCPQPFEAASCYDGSSSGGYLCYIGSDGDNTATILTGDPTVIGSTGPSTTELTDGSYAIAYQDSSGYLCVYLTSTGSDNCTGLGMAGSTESPSIAALSNGSESYVVAFEAAGGSLYLDQNGTPISTGLGMQAGTNPSVAIFPGGYGVAFQANTGALCLYGMSNGCTGLGMNSQASPAALGYGSGLIIGFDAAGSANNLYTYNTSTSGATNWGLGMATAATPSMTAVSGGWAVGFRANTGNLYVYSTTTGANATPEPVLATTTPSLSEDGWGNYRATFDYLNGSQDGIFNYYYASNGITAGSFSLAASSTPASGPNGSA